MRAPFFSFKRNYHLWGGGGSWLPLTVRGGEQQTLREAGRRWRKSPPTTHGHGLGEGGGGQFFYSQKKFIANFFEDCFFNFHQFYFFKYRIERRKICTVKMVQLLWPKKGYSFHRKYHGFFCYGSPFFSDRGGDLFLTHRGVHPPSSPPPPCPCVPPTLFIFQQIPPPQAEV